MAKYRITGPDGATYEVNAPDDASEQDVLAYAQSNFSPAGGMDQKQSGGLPSRPDRSAPVQALRYAGLGSKGFADSALETLASPLEMSGKAAGALGISDYQPGSWTERLKSGYRAIGQTMAQPVDAAIQSAFGPVDAGPATPENASERFSYGAGRGAADVGAVFAPALAASKMAQTGSLAQRLGATLAEAPKMQLASGMVGGGVSEMTDSPLAGVGAALAVPTAAAMGQRLITPVENQLTPELRRLAAQAQAEGIPLTPGQQTGSKALQLTESVFNRLPMTSGASEAGRQTQREAFNRAVLQRAGIEAENAGPDVLAAAQKRLGGRFEDLAARNTVAVDDDLRQAIEGIRGEYNRNLTPDVRAIVDNYVEDILAQGDEIAGKTYQKARSAMTRRAKTATDPELANTLKSLRNALDDAAGRSISPEDALAWDAARKQYGNLKTIEKAMGSSTPTAIAGNIPPTQLQNAARMSRSDYARGGGDLNDLARIGNAFVRENVPDSGTAQRTWLQNILTAGTAGGGAGLAGLDPTGVAMTAAGAYALPKAVQTLYNQPWFQRYLTNELIQRSPQMAPVALNQAAIAAPQTVGRLTDMLSR